MAESPVPSQPGGAYTNPAAIPSKDTDPKGQQTLSHKTRPGIWLMLFLAAALVICVAGWILYRSRKSTHTGNKNNSYVMTINDSGKTLQTRPGDSISLHLTIDKNLTETLSIENSNMLLVQQPLTYNPSTNTFDTVIQTRVPGMTKVSVLGRPKCRQHAMCSQYIILEFTMNVHIQQ